MGPQQVGPVKVLVALGQLKRHRVHLGCLDFDLAIALQRQNMTTALPVLGYKVEVVAVDTDPLQIMGLPEIDKGTTDVLESERDLVFADLE